MKYTPLAFAAAALTAGLVSFGSAQAANVMTASSAPTATTASADGNIQLAAHRYYWAMEVTGAITIIMVVPVCGWDWACRSSAARTMTTTTIVTTMATMPRAPITRRRAAAMCAGA